VGVWILLDCCGWPSTFGRFSTALLVSKNPNLDFVLLFLFYFGGDQGLLDNQSYYVRQESIKEVVKFV